MITKTMTTMTKTTMTMTMTMGRGRSRSRNLSIAGAGNYKNGRLRQPCYYVSEQTFYILGSSFTMFPAPFYPRNSFYYSFSFITKNNSSLS